MYNTVYSIIIYYLISHTGIWYWWKYEGQCHILSLASLRMHIYTNFTTNKYSLPNSSPLIMLHYDIMNPEKINKHLGASDAT